MPLILHLICGRAMRASLSRERRRKERERKQSVVTLVRVESGQANSSFRGGGGGSILKCSMEGESEGVKEGGRGRLSVAHGAVAAIRAAMIGHACRRRARNLYTATGLPYF